jgi:anti-anti-sigma regulatory factor
MITRPAAGGSSSAPSRLTVIERQLLMNRARLVEETLAELRAVLDDPGRSVESVEAHRLATQELDRLSVLLRVSDGSEHCAHDLYPLDAPGWDPADLQRATSERLALVVTRDDSHVVVTLNAPVDGSTLDRTLTGLIDDQGNHSVRVECRSPGYMDPVGAASLLGAAARLAGRRGRFALVGGAAELRRAVALIGGDHDDDDLDASDPDAAMQDLHRLALGLRTAFPRGADPLVDVGLDRLDDLTRDLSNQAFRSLVVAARPVHGPGPGARRGALAADDAAQEVEPW